MEETRKTCSADAKGFGGTMRSVDGLRYSPAKDGLIGSILLPSARCPHSIRTEVAPWHGVLL